MLEEAFGKAKNLLASAMYYPYRMIVASSVWVLPSRILACWGIPQAPDLLLRAGNAFCKRWQEILQKAKNNIWGILRLFLIQFRLQRSAKSVQCHGLGKEIRWRKGDVFHYTHFRRTNRKTEKFAHTRLVKSRVGDCHACLKTAKAPARMPLASARALATWWA